MQRWNRLLTDVPYILKWVWDVKYGRELSISGLKRWKLKNKAIIYLMGWEVEDCVWRVLGDHVWQNLGERSWIHTSKATDIWLILMFYKNNRVYFWRCRNFLISQSNFFAASLAFFLYPHVFLICYKIFYYAGVSPNKKIEVGVEPLIKRPGESVM